MADKQEKTESTEKQSEEKRTEDSVLPVDLFSRRYTLDECREIGKGMLEALKTAIQPEEVGYIPALQEPHAKAWKYLEESHALLLMEILMTKVVYEQPSEPLKFMIDEVEKMRGTDLAKSNPLPK